MADLREIVLDTESTGLDYRQGDRIIEIGCIELINRIKTDKFFHTYINPQRTVSKGAFDVHGISSDFLRDKPLFSDIAQEFSDFIQDSKLIIHNAKFDIGFINNEFFLIGMPKISISRAIDTWLMAKKKFPGSPTNLDALCKRFNISLDKRSKHGALIDSELLAMVYVELSGRNQTKFKFQNISSQTLSDIKNYTNFPSRKFALSELEKKLHKGLIQSIKNPLWNKYD